MTLKEFIEKLKRLDENSKLEFTYWNKKLDWGYIWCDDWFKIITIDLVDDTFNS